jgi:hypothetical protein
VNLGRAGRIQERELVTGNLFRNTKNLVMLVLLLATSSLVAPDTHAHAQLHWPDPGKKVALRVRMVALAVSYPRSTFFASHEVLIAERELATDEWSLIKVVYSYLPYQPKLSETGFDYSVVHDLTASRDPKCDETVDQLTSRDWPNNSTITLKYSKGADKRDLAGRRIPLPCFETSADDYSKKEDKPAPTE